MKEEPTILLGTIGKDVHSWGLRMIEYALKSEGFKVVNLGVQVSQEDFVDAARETNAAAILISSLSGHSLFDCEGLREKCIEAGMRDIILWAGGYLAIGDLNWAEVEKKFKDLGFQRIYPQTVLPPKIISDLKEDLKAKGYSIPAPKSS